jgi:YbgC/YbaW family acyl-CoA thioester hydrolase
MGIVYYANYFIWFEVARTDLLRHAGWSYREMEHEISQLLGPHGAGPSPTIQP